MVGILKREIDLVSIIESADVELRKSGTRYVGLCPFHNEKTPSFFVFDGDRRFKCFGCGEGGDVIDFVQKLYGLSFKEALKHLGIGGQVTSKIRADIEKRKRRAELIKQFERWRGRYLAHLGTLINRTLKLMKNIPPDDLHWYASLLDAMPIWEHHSDILLNGSDKEKLKLYREARKNGNF